MNAADLRVAVIDDESEVLELVKDVLEDEGMTVTAIHRPEKVPDIYRGGRPHCVLIDMMLPGMSGIDLARRLTAGGLKGTPLIAMSASTTMLREAEESGLFDDILAKPFDISELLHMVNRHASTRRAVRSGTGSRSAS